MADIKPRTKTEWHVVCNQHHASNRSFKKEPSARKYALALEAKGKAAVRVVEKSITVWFVRIRRVGATSFSKTFDRKNDAEQWAREKEGEIAKRQFVDHRAADGVSLKDLLLKYEEKKLSEKHKSDADRCRIRMLANLPWAQTRMSALTSVHIAEHRDHRLTMVKGATVKKELELVSRVIGLARREWGVHLPFNVASGQLVSRPAPQPGDERDRRLSDVHNATPKPLSPTHLRSKATLSRKKASGKEQRPSLTDSTKADQALTQSTSIAWVVPPQVVAWMQLPQTEEQALLRACRYPWLFQPQKADVGDVRKRERAWRRRNQPGVKFKDRDRIRLWALVSIGEETAMRRGELLKLHWSHVRLEQGYLDLPGWLTKNKKPRIVPLSLRALRILKTQPKTSDRVFPYSDNTVKLAFNRARARCGSEDLRFHDLRHEATSRLFERTTLRESEIGSITGHTDPRSLQRYYNKRPTEFVNRFLESFNKAHTQTSHAQPKQLGARFEQGETASL